MAFEELKSSGITTDTPKNIMLGAGTIHKGLTFQDGRWNFEESLLGATSGGTKVEIVPVFLDIPIDGATVEVKGFKQKNGEKATMTVNLAEVTGDAMKMATVGQEKASAYTGYKEIVSRGRISDGDYIENLGYIGHKTDGTPIIIVFDWAICVSGLSLEGKNGEASTFQGVFNCVAENTPEADTLPWHIYYPEK